MPNNKKSAGYKLEPGPRGFDGGRFRYPAREAIRHTPKRLFDLPYWAQEEVTRSWDWCDERMLEAFPKGGTYDPSWDEKKLQIREQAWRRLTDKARSLVTLEDFERGFYAVCRMMALKAALEQEPGSGDDSRKLPKRIYEQLGEMLREFTGAELDLLERHADRIARQRAKGLRAKRGQDVPLETQRPDLLIELLEIAKALKKGEYPERTAADVVSHDPHRPKDRPMRKVNKEITRSGKEERVPYEAVDSDRIEDSSAEGHQDLDAARQQSALFRAYRELLEKYRDDAKRLAALRCLVRDFRSLRDAEEQTGVPKSTIARHREEVEKELARRARSHA